ncbi:MAG: hypothetical protein H0X30_00340 [Anaerolineae bacterium]|nr:hypothetical protein [Anaerolineae bacterium]
MNSKEELVEEFGKQLIEQVRDNQIRFIDSFLEQKSFLSSKYKEELDGMSHAQIDMLKEMAVRWVDGTLHDLLYLLEDAKWIHLRFENEGNVVEDIRQITDADLQAYIFIWAEKYSTTRLTDYTKG